VDIVVSGRNVPVTEAVKEAVRGKIGSLDRFLGGLERADVVFKEERNPRIEAREHVEVTLEGHGHHIRARSTGVDQLHAVDLAVNKLEKQLGKLKTRVVRRRRPNLRRDDSHHPLQRALNGEQVGPAVDASTQGSGAPTQTATGAADDWAAADLGDGEELDREPVIVRTKSIELSPMTADEAVLRMELLGHGFFLFCNRDTGRATVVYQRDDGDIGLIEGIDSDAV
jgi:putative sigma-54 modulation protein